MSHLFLSFSFLKCHIYSSVFHLSNVTFIPQPESADDVKVISPQCQGASATPEEIAPVAYMIVFGDAVHNFIDGLSIGSAFTISTMAGVSVSFAVMFEELPLELG